MSTVTVTQVVCDQCKKEILKTSWHWMVQYQESPGENRLVMDVKKFDPNNPVDYEKDGEGGTSVNWEEKMVDLGDPKVVVIEEMKEADIHPGCLMNFLEGLVEGIR